MPLILASVALLLCITIGTPIAFSLGASVISGLLVDGRTNLILIPTKMVEGVDGFVLLALPLFILAGALMDVGGISLRIMRFAQSLVGHFPGGLPMTAVVSEMLFSGISGSTMADASAIASMDLPPMKRAGYKPEYAVAVISAASAMGVLIPPCIMMIVLGSLMNVSVAALFLAGFIPAAVLAATLFILIAYQARKYHFPKGQKQSFGEIIRAFRDSLLALGMFIIIFGGILGGAMTPTEAAAIAVVYALLVGTLIYREFTLYRLWEILRDCAAQSAMVLFILAVANIYSFLLATLKVPETIVGLISQANASPWFFLVVTQILLILLCSVIEPLPAMVLFVPILLPIVDRLGIDRLHYAILLTAATGIGVFIPPLGPGLILICSIARVRMEQTLLYLGPFLLMLFVGLIVLTFIPWFTTVLPSHLLPHVLR